MKIVIYSTHSEKFHGDHVRASYHPRRADAWDALAAQYPDHEIVVVAPKTPDALFDLDGKDVALKPKRVEYVFTENGMDMDAVVRTILDQKPDAAIALTVAARGLDWNPVMDAMIAEQLRKSGVETVVAHSVPTAMGAFDKWRSSMMLRSARLPVAASLYIHNHMFWAEEEAPTIQRNVYKDYVLHRLEDLAYPVIIKSTTGAGSMGITVAEDLETARRTLLAKNNHADVIVEEMLPGEQFGTEIHSDGKGSYHVLPPIAFSINEEGVTDPYTGVKFGPVDAEKYRVPEMQAMLKRMAEEFHFGASAEVDLVFRDGEWKIIEINPRWSGLSTTAAAAEKRHPWAIYMDALQGSDQDYSNMANLGYAANFKIAELSEEQQARLAEMPGVRYVGSTVSEVPGRDRVAICEVVLGGFKTREELLAAFDNICREFPGSVAPKTAEHLRELCERTADE